MERLSGFMDVPDRNLALETQEASIIRDALPADIWDKFGQCFLDGDIVSTQAEEVLSHLKDNSIITQMVQTDPTSSLTFESLRVNIPRSLLRSLPSWIPRSLLRGSSLLVPDLVMIRSKL